MPKFKTKEETYKSCLADGFYRNLKYVNKERIKSLVVNANTNIYSARTLAKSLTEEDKRWMNVYTLHYEAIRIYTEALFLFEKITSSNHQCLFAYLCIKRPEFDWNFFEKIRKKRHGVNYYGEQITYEEWKAVEPQFKLYISVLKKELEKKLIDSSEK